MRPRSFTLNTLEIVIPVAIAAIVAVGAFLFLNPVFGQGQTANPSTIRIYASVPRPAYDSIVHGVQMAIDEVSSKAGDFRIEFVPMQRRRSSENGSSKWDPDVELANARRAANDPDAMIYIGTYNSGAAKISIPVLNRVSMAMISPRQYLPRPYQAGHGRGGRAIYLLPPWSAQLLPRRSRRRFARRGCCGLRQTDRREIGLRPRRYRAIRQGHRRYLRPRIQLTSASP